MKTTFTPQDEKRIAAAQRRNARTYRENARVAPWNSQTRQEWLGLARAAESCARNIQRL